MPVDTRPGLEPETARFRTELLVRLERCNRQVMKRCFMTGKHCIFSANVSAADRKSVRAAGTLEVSDSSKGDTPPPSVAPVDFDPNVFIVMPFAPNIETFYRWSLKPFLTRGYGIPEECVQRADEVRDIGYIVCEKICLRIQGADLILADISLENSNVFYEIGLARGLGRPLVLMQNTSTQRNVLADVCVRQSLDLKENSPESLAHVVLKYPGVGELSREQPDHMLPTRVRLPDAPPKVSRKLEICLLKPQRSSVGTTAESLPNEAGKEGKSTQSSDVSELVDLLSGRRKPQPRPDDIPLDFADILKGAVGVAMAEIRVNARETMDKINKLTGENAEAKRESVEPWVEVVEKVDPSIWSAFSGLKTLAVNEQTSFAKIAETIESSFATVIDISGNDSVAYFWLGYAHARGLNVIPVYRQGSSSKASVGFGERREERLAFDIHALWYAEYDEDKPYDFKNKIREILEHLLSRDLPYRQKRAFWDRFPAQRKLKVLTGAIHVEELNREMSGDWDLRTVSELFSYLPSVREAMAIELATPIYSPEEAFKRRSRVTKATSRTEFLNGYLNHIEAQLENANAIVIASPDVNPITEYLLHQIYSVESAGRAFEDSSKATRFTGYVVVKQLSDKRKLESSPEGGALRFPRLFFQEVDKSEITSGVPQLKDAKDVRGFGFHTDKFLSTDDFNLFAEYFSQDDCRDSFHLLGHLVVARHPANGDGLVVLLNGVSGPATFALAQVLTGGGLSGSRELNARSERLLEIVNGCLDEPGSKGVEVIVRVKISPAEKWADQTYLDSRQVKDWDFQRRDPHSKKPDRRNEVPKEVYFLRKLT